MGTVTACAVRSGVAAVLLCGPVPLIASAQVPAGYPSKPIRMIVPYAPGGGADVLARVVSLRFGEVFQQPVVVDNRAGGGGLVGSETAVRATPDGHTLAFVSGAYTTMAALRKLPYHPVDDIAPIVMVGEASSILVVHPSVAAKSTRELIDYARANPGKLNYGSGGTGGFSHLVTALFDLMAGTRMIHVAYKGTGPALNDLLGGQLQVIIGSTPSTAVHVRSGRLRALGITSKERSSALPDVPPISEVVPGYYAPLLYGIWGPKGLPPAIVELWNREVGKLLQSADMKARLTSAGVDPVGGAPSRFRDELRADVERWRKVVVAADIRVSD